MLKLLACLFMLIDHIGFFFGDTLPLDLVVLMRTVGRLAFPLFAYSIALGFRRTRSPLRYLCRMLLFAFLTEAVLRITAAQTGHAFPVNVLFTFATALVFLIGYDLATRSYWDMIATLKLVRSPGSGPFHPDFPVRIVFGETGLPPHTGLAFGVLLAAAALAANVLLEPDYGLYGLASVWVFHISAAQIRPKEDSPDRTSTYRKRTLTGLLVLNLVFLPVRILLQHVPVDWALLQLFSLLAIPLILTPRSEPRPSSVLRYAFYLFYPVHIALLMLLSHWISG